MSGVKNWVIGMVAVILLAGGIGCAALSQLLTPANVDKKAVVYAASAGVVDADDFRGYANMEKAIRLQVAVESAFQVKELALNQMLDKNKLDYALLKDVTISNTQIARAREEKIFGEKGLLSMGLGLMGFGTLTGMLGLMRKRPGDITSQEMELAVADIKGEVTTKDRQLIEIVKGVQVFLDAHPKTDPVGAELRTALAKQSVDTRQAVAVAKTTV